MRLTSNYSFDFEKQSETYYKLLCEEDFDFKTKNITIEVRLENSLVLVEVRANCVLDLKIATSALIKSLEIIERTLNV